MLSKLSIDTNTLNEGRGGRRKVRVRELKESDWVSGKREERGWEEGE